MRIVLEPLIPPHDPRLYAATKVAEGVDGFAAVDQSGLDSYRDEGFLLVRGGYSVDEVAAARAELEAMATADDPRCAAVYYEGALRRYLPENADTEESREQEPQGLPDDSPTVARLALGADLAGLPAVDRKIRASLVRKFAGFTKEHPPLAALAKKPELKALLKKVIGPRLRLFQTMAMIKPPGGREKPWHQDHAYFNLPLDAKIAGIWIALDRVTAENGAMVVLAGGHKEGPRLHFKRRDWQICDTDILGLSSTVVPMNPGDVLIFDGKLPHGTPTNATDTQRWAVQIHYIGRDVSETPEEERLAIFGSEGKGVSC